MHSSFFYKNVEAVKGDLTDIVRASGIGDGRANFDDHNFVPLSDLPDVINYNNLDVDVRPVTSFQEFTTTTTTAANEPSPTPTTTRPIKPTPRFLPLVSSNSSAIGGKRRKGQAKKVVCVPAPSVDQDSSKGSVVVPSDLWAWRKYGQKPIKGSPYPRGYYRCSSSKGCLARKQVERSMTDPTMLVITYTQEHNHPWPTQRNSLSGSSRSRNYVSRNSVPDIPTVPSASHFETKLDTETIKDADKYEFEQVFNHSYDESESFTDLFGELGGLEPDPVSLIFPNSRELLGTDKLQLEGETKDLDPLNLFDLGWELA